MVVMSLPMSREIVRAALGPPLKAAGLVVGGKMPASFAKAPGREWKRNLVSRFSNPKRNQSSTDTRWDYKWRNLLENLAP